MIELYDHQREVVERVERSSRVRVLLADDTGTGKTMTAIASVEALGDDAFPVLVVCPKAVAYGWEEEWKRYNGGRRIYVAVAPTPVRKRLKILKECSVDVLVTNYETLLGAQPAFFKALPFRTVVFDEAHRLRNGTTKTHRRSVALGNAAKNAFLLTATPAERRPSDYWGLLAVLRPDLYTRKLRSWRNMVAQYEVVDQYWRFIAPKRGASEVLAKEVSSSCLYFSRRKEDCIDLPDLTEVVVKVPFNGRAKELYVQLCRYGVALASGDEPIVPSSALSLMQRLRLLAETCAVDPFNENDEGNSKLDYLKQLMETVDCPVVVFTEFVRVADWIESHLGAYRVVRITGREGAHERQVAIREVQEGRAEFCLCTYGAGGEGVNLQRSHHVVLFGLPLSHTKYHQAISRVYRAGTRVPVTVHVLSHKVPRLKGVLDVESKVFRLIKAKKKFHVSMVEAWLREAMGDETA